MKVPGKDETAETNMVACIIWAVYFKSEVRFDLGGSLEALVEAPEATKGSIPYKQYAHGYVDD